jgi:hypothetical protein
MVPPPPGMNSETLRTQCLTELAGMLCLFSWGCPERYYDVWLLREHGTWFLHCRIDGTAGLISTFNRYHCYPYIRPLAIVDNGRRILLFDETGFRPAL